MPIDDLSPPVTARRLPPRIVRNRSLQAGRDGADRERFEHVIDAHAAARRKALDALADWHQALADESDLDLVGDTRPAAVWQMMGRCIGIARAMLDLLALGYAAEVLHLGRALHEATRLLSALGDDEEDSLLRKWLAGKYVSPADVRKAEQRYEERLAAKMVAEGETELPRTETLTREIHKRLSEAVHHQRPAVHGEVSLQLRIMRRGPDPVWERRAADAPVILMLVGETIDSVGGALEHFHGPPWYAENVKPYLAAFETLAREQPLR
jgi:hypothetical protein